MSFKPGNIVQLRLQNFRALRDITIKFQPGINYFVAPNGHGKSSVLMGIVLGLGSDWKELQDLHRANQLVRESCSQGTVEIFLAEREVPVMKLTSNIRRITVTLGADKSTIFKLDGHQVSKLEIQKLVQKLRVFPDNPFTSMMQLEAQRITNEPPSKRLSYVLQLCGTEIEAQMNKTLKLKQNFKELKLVSQYDKAKNDFEQDYSNFKKGVQVQEQQKSIEDLKKKKLYLEQFNILSQAYELGHNQEMIEFEIKNESVRERDAQDQIIALQKELQKIDDKIEKLELKKKEQFKIMKTHSDDQEKQKHALKVIRNEYELQAKYYHQLKSQFDAQKSNKTQDMWAQKAELDDQLEQMKAKISKLEKEQEQLQSNTGTNNVFTQDIDSKLQKVNEQIYSIKNQKINFINQSGKFRSYLNAINEQYPTIEPNATAFMLLPTINYIQIASGIQIPKTNAQQIVATLMGFDLYSLYTNSQEQFVYVTHQYKNYRGAATTVKKLESLSGKTYEEAYEISKLKLAQRNNQRIITNKIGDNYVKCSDIITGNPIIVSNIVQQFNSSIYIKSYGKNNKELTEDEVRAEVDYIFEANANIYRIFTDKKVYTSLRHNSQYRGREVGDLYDNELSRSIMQFDPSKQYDVTELLKEKSALEAKKQEQLRQLEDQQRQNEQRRHLIQQVMEQLNSLKQDKRAAEQKRNDIQYHLDNNKVITKEELAAQSAELNKTKTKAAAVLMRIIHINDLVQAMLKNDSGLIIDIQKLQLQQKAMNEQIGALSSVLIEIQDKVSKLQESKKLIDHELQEICYAVQNHFKHTDYKKLFKQYSESSQLAALIIELNLTTTTKEDLERVISRLAQQIQNISRQQIHDLPTLQSRILKNINLILRNYATLQKAAEQFIKSFEMSKERLEQFVGELSVQFKANLQKFNVNGGLSLKLFIEKTKSEIIFNQLKKYVKSDFSQQFGAFQSQYKDCYGLVDLDLVNEVQRDRETDTGLSHQEFYQQLQEFKLVDMQLLEFEYLLNSYQPGLEIEHQFAKSESLKGASLSGGERSVISICLAACCKETNLILIDEINQGMDENFETAAHNLILQLGGQVLVSSPKLGQDMEFPTGVAVHVFIK
ncbi:RecF/RecN/SMC_N terminal domain-containing protein [Hexamita inflata]|uniref:Structural maintenance of chromosomes protein 5 n=1 Tax=Hexamita inflata TaxID=28002 RepID=A0AA86NZ81_9EUKA|nr:RecF/RecN/SMC N terminal domain-containing protein [Hexamita inflata]